MSKISPPCGCMDVAPSYLSPPTPAMRAWRHVRTANEMSDWFNMCGIAVVSRVYCNQRAETRTRCR